MTEFPTSDEDRAELRAFIIMPFARDLQDVYDQLILPALEAAGYRAKRADNMELVQNILADIVKGIAEADLVVADLSGLNANVLYELGIAHGLEKPTIMLAQDAEALPFDLRAYRVITYSLRFAEAGQLRENLETVARRYAAASAAGQEGRERLGSGPVSDFALIKHESAPSVGGEAPVDVPVEETATAPDVLETAAKLQKSLGHVASAMDELRAANRKIADEINARSIGFETATGQSTAAFRISSTLLNVTNELDPMLDDLKTIAERLPDAFSHFFTSLDFHVEGLIEAVQELMSTMRSAQAASRAFREEAVPLKELLQKLSARSEGLAFMSLEFDRRLTEVSERAGNFEAYLIRAAQLLATKLESRDSVSPQPD